MVFILFLIGFLAQTGPAQDEFSNFAPTAYPDRVMLTIPGDPASTRAVSWRSVYEDTVSIGQIVVAVPSPNFGQNPRVITGTYSAWETGNRTAMGHKVVFEGLMASTMYAYRVGNGAQWSEWFQFKTSSAQAGPFSFLYFGDVQDDIKSGCSRVLRQAYSHFPNVDFMLFAGDLVSKSQDADWHEFFYAGGWVFGTKPSLATPGNHEYERQVDKSRIFSKHWEQIFTTPDNAPSKTMDRRTYFIDYQGVRFVSFDSPAMDYGHEDSGTMLHWLDKVLAENPHRWAVVFTHYPVWTCSQGRDSEKYRDAIKPILEEHGVDIVLQGHDHTYCRGFNLPQARRNSKNLPLYVVSVVGTKMYGLNTNVWSDRVGSDLQLYQHISFSGDTLGYQSFTADGQLYDGFMIVKDKNGTNHFVESGEVPGINQRTGIPESAIGKYTKEDLQRYRQKIQKQ